MTYKLRHRCVLCGNNICFFLLSFIINHHGYQYSSFSVSRICGPSMIIVIIIIVDVVVVVKEYC